MKSSKDAKTALHTLLAQKAREHYGPNSAVDNLTKLSGGASRETWSFDIVDGDTEEQGLIVQAKVFVALIRTMPR